MTTETGAPVADAAPASDTAEVIVQGSLEGEAFSADQAYDAYLKRNSPAESATEATAEPEITADPATDPGETTTEEADPALPLIERPRSWAKELDEEWASYPREAQEKIAKREQDRDAAIRRSQNEAADARKAAEAERTQAEQARKNYEAQLPALLQELQNSQQASFGDIKTIEDVAKLQSEDPFRFQAWQVQQMKLQAATAENEKARHAAETAKQSDWAKFVAEQNKLASERIPELADETKAQTLRTGVAKQLETLGFSNEELRGLANGEKVSLFDHRIQELLFNNLKYQEVKSAPVKAIPKPVPAVQRPGVAAPRGNTDAIQTSRNKLNSTGSVEDAYALYVAKQKARA